MSPEVVLRLVLDEGDRLIDEGFEEEPAAVAGKRQGEFHLKPEPDHEVPGFR